MECNIAFIYQVLEGYPTFVLKDAPFTQKILQHSWFPLPTEVQTNHQAIKLYTLPETNIAPDKWMVGRGSFPFGMTFFQGCKLLVSGRVLIIIYIYIARSRQFLWKAMKKPPSKTLPPPRGGPPRIRATMQDVPKVSEVLRFGVRLVEFGGFFSRRKFVKNTWGEMYGWW